MIRRAYGLLVGVAIAVGATALIAAEALGMSIRDPDGFLGPSWVRFPLLCLGAFLVDVIPRAAWRARKAPRQFWPSAQDIVREHWTRDRIALVVIGLGSFYVTYVSYRNLKSFLPFVREGTQDLMLKNLDEWLMFGHNPAIVIHDLLGTGVAAHVLSFVYLFFLLFVPISLVGWLVWSRNISFGYWYVTALCLCWVLGVVSYYAIPSLGPGFESPWLYSELATTPTASLQGSLTYSRYDVLLNPFSAEGIQGVAGFASLHVAIVLCATLIAHYTVRHAVIRWGMWVFFVLTVLATIYFGWHYIADDVAGAAIGAFAVWIGGLATGQEFDKHGRASHPTTSTSNVPVEDSNISRR